MAKIGTAHVEIKPVLNAEALAEIMQQVEDAVAAGVERGMERAKKTVTVTEMHIHNPTPQSISAFGIPGPTE